MQISVTSNVNEVKKTLTRIQRRQIPYATSVAINNTAVKLLKVEQGAMKKHLDRPRKQTITALKLQRSNKKKIPITARLYFTDWANRYMVYQVYGGTRPVKTVVPLNQYGGKLNAYGSIPARKSRGWAKKHKQFFVESKGKTLLMRPKGRDDQAVVGVMTDNPVYKKRYPFYEIADGVVKRVFPKEFNRALAEALRTAR